ncbi:hypothetical protein QYF36_010844 [Acer negundo]|nr:hypothetical protein QYF36_010844 [Acer negundo]
MIQLMMMKGLLKASLASKCSVKQNSRGIVEAERRSGKSQTVKLSKNGYRESECNRVGEVRLWNRVGEMWLCNCVLAMESKEGEVRLVVDMTAKSNEGQENCKLSNCQRMDVENLNATALEVRDLTDEPYQDQPDTVVINVERNSLV